MRVLREVVSMRRPVARPYPRAPLRIEQMTTRAERNWTAQIVIASDHAGLKPEFRALENEMYKALSRVDEPREVKHYLMAMRRASREWRQIMAAADIEK
jgi:hypothetical protein